MNATDIRRGMVLNFEGDLFIVHDFTHITPGKGNAVVQTKLKNLKSGTIISRRFRSVANIDVVFLETKTMEYLYQDGSNYCFMDTETYDQIMFSNDVVGDVMPYLAPNAQVQVTFHEGQPVGVEIPAAVVLEVTQTEPGVKGNTVTNVFKPATLETGLDVKVPMFIDIGDKVKVDTRTGEFLERAN